MKIFISFADEDKELATQIYDRLRLDGFQVWMSAIDLIPGTDRRLEIKKAVRESNAVLICVSNALIRGVGSMNRETKDALDIADEQPEGSIFVIPVELEDCALPQRLAHLEPVLYFEPDGYHNLVRAISQRKKQLQEDANALGSRPSVDRTLVSNQPTSPIQASPQKINAVEARKPSPLPSQRREEDRDKDDKGGVHDANILRVFGKYGGIAGLGLGVLFLLFGRLAFPTLTAEQATPYMFFVYGAAVLGMIIWAAKAEDSRSLKFLLAVVAVIIGLFAWLTLPKREPPESGYAVLVTVNSPSNAPVANAHVTSSLGGEVLQTGSGWKINFPLSDKGKKLTVYADVADQGWTGSANEQLGDSHSPSLTISLRESIDLPVRGIVLDSSRRAVPNAAVSIVGYDATFTQASGDFELDSHAGRGETIHIHAEKPPNLVADKTDYKVGSGAVELILQSPEEQNPTLSRKRHSDAAARVPAGQVTGDAVIDRVIANLNSRQQSGTLTESELADILAPLFERPAFYNTRQQDWRYFLYALCRTRLLLEQHEGEFKTQPSVRENISNAVKTMVDLQNEVATLYGPNFHIDDQIKRYINNSGEFIRSMPAQKVDPSPQFFDERDHQITEIRQFLHAARIL